MELFDKQVCEVEHEGVRYILRRNPMRAAEMAATRADKQAAQKHNSFSRLGLPKSLNSPTG